MKQIIINYDFINAINNINEPLSPMKLVRNRKKVYLLVPILFIVDLKIEEQLLLSLESLGIQTCILTGIIMTSKKDTYKEKSEKEVEELIPKLEELNIYTDKKIIKDSKLFEKKYKIELNNNKIPLLKESKYILVPSYTFNDRIIDKFICQDHFIGTNNYILSATRPNKEMQLIYRIN